MRYKVLLVTLERSRRTGHCSLALTLVMARCRITRTPDVLRSMRMALILVVLGDADLRLGLCRALGRHGHEALGVPAWSSNRSTQPTAPTAAVFEHRPETSTASDRISGFLRLRDQWPSLIGITLVEARVPRMDSGRARLHFIRWAPVPKLAARVAGVLASEVKAQVSKRVLDELHERVLSGDDAARDDFCRRMFQELHRQFRSVPYDDPHFVDLAIDNALIRYCARPGLYDPIRGHPVALIRKIAIDALSDLRRSYRRHVAHEVAAGVQFDTLAVHERACSGLTVDSDCTVKQRSALLSVARTAAERAFIDAWLGDSHRLVLARTLGLDQSGDVDQRIAIHRTQARLRQRARRAFRAPVK